MAQTCGGAQQPVLSGRAKNPTKSALPPARVASTAMDKVVAPSNSKWHAIQYSATAGRAA